MNLTTQCEKLQSLITHTLMGVKPLQPRSTVVFNEESVHIGAMFMSVVSCYGNFKKSYFGTKYKTSSSEYIVLTNSLQKRLQESFSQKVVDFYTDKENLYIDSEDGKTNYEEALIKPEETVTAEKFPIPMAVTEYGYLPSTIKELPVKLFVKASDLRFPLGSEYVSFDFKDSHLKTRIETIGKLKQEIDIASLGPEAKGKSVTSKVLTNNLMPILGALEGNVWLILHSEAMLLLETDDDHSVTYLIATKRA